MSSDQYPTHALYRSGILEQYVSDPHNYDVEEFDVVELAADHWLSAERDRVWSLVKVQRAELTAGGCDVPLLGRIQTRPDSLAAIEQSWGAAQADPQDWSTLWTMEDNRREPIDHAGMRSIKLAADAHVNRIRAAADAVYADLFAPGVTTLAGLAGISVDLLERMA